MRNKTIKGIVMILIVLAVFFVTLNSSHAIGLAPSRNVIDFTPNLEQELTFRVINTENKDMTLAVYSQEELGKYIELEQNIVEIKSSESEKEIKYKINLPDKLEPGSRKANLVVVEIPKEKSELVVVNMPDNDSTLVLANSEHFEEQESMVSAQVVLIHQLRVNVPYPGKYIQGKVYIDEVNVNETATFTLSLFNQGKETISKAKATIVIKGPTNDEIAVVRTNEISLNPQQEAKVAAYWSADVGEGNYYAEVIVEYDEEILLLSKSFKVGSLKIEIDALKVDNFKLGTIAKFDILLRSKWNDEIPDVYANMQVIDKAGITLTDFKTSSVNIKAKGTATVSGYWDTSNVKVGDYDVNVKLNYGNKTAEKLFQTVVSIDRIEVQQALTGQAISGKNSMRDSLLVILVIILVVVNIISFMWRRRKRDS
jgi:hypothetical protein